MTQRCREMINTFARQVGSHRNTDEFNEKLYLLKLVAAGRDVDVSELFEENYCPEDIVTYYAKHPTRLVDLDEYKFEDINPVDLDIYVKVTSKKMDEVIHRFSTATSRKMSQLPERARMTAWAQAITPPTVASVYEMSKRNVLTAEALTAEDKSNLRLMLLEYTLL